MFRNLKYILYILVIDFFCSYYIFCDLYRRRRSHRPSYVTFRPFDLVIFVKYPFLLPLGQWAQILPRSGLRLSWLQPSIKLIHISCDHAIFEKSCISTSTTSMTIKITDTALYGTCRLRNRKIFEKCYISNLTRPQNSAGNTNHKKTHINITLKIFRLCR